MFDIRRVSSEIYGENHLAITELKGSKFFLPAQRCTRVVYPGCLSLFVCHTPVLCLNGKLSSNCVDHFVAKHATLLFTENNIL